MDRIDNYKFLAKAAKALGDRYRLLIFREIQDRGSMMLRDVIELTNLAQPSVSFHVKQLVEAGILDAEKKGREVYLTINKETVDRFFADLDQIKALTKRD
jgi:ArsR family transcriptional regulator, arsenate/arsenite/antimonite-responsive transcriptional repressor